MSDTWPEIPPRLQETAHMFPECSYGASRVALLLKDGRRVEDVYLAWGRQIVKIGQRKISYPEELDFETSDIVDLVSTP
jgi:hypothetical protein